MALHPPVLDLRGPASGYHEFHPDRSLNFQCNRWLEWIGPEAHDEIAEAVRVVRDYQDWIEAFLALANQVRAEGRALAAAYYDRAAEFFIPPHDPRKAAARGRFLATLREQYGVQPDRVAYEGAWLPAYDLRPEQASGSTLVVFGGFDSYIEEFLPMLTAIAATGHRVLAFEGPGQGSALEDAGLGFTPEWERPVAAVLDHYGLDDVTAIGISLGGGLVIRAAAFETRIRRAVAWDILDDFVEVIGRQITPGAAPVIRALLVLRARRVLNVLARIGAACSPVSRWGLWQGMHITAAPTPYDFFAGARTVTTRKISGRVTADVLLIAGADDHYVPLHQLHRQARNLTTARSVTTRVFTAAEQASNHCQIGNTGACIRSILSWMSTVTPSEQPSPFGS
ncbi:alpha/beta fold hydrolase [uncultured Mycobacterium sp.]|uniref:alpha/beta fold hydrolase n=1 Tax=uncultured Mycobacterium sp. TaxID=171292 RepID=UPI0035CA0C4D